MAASACVHLRPFRTASKTNCCKKPAPHNSWRDVHMISRREIRELAAFHADARRACPLSFYFQPQTPQDKSHREEMILAKDLIKSAMREIKHNGKNTGVAEDLHRMLEVAQDLRGNQTQAKVIFACGKRNFWREFDLPPWLPGSAIATGHRFHLK